VSLDPRRADLRRVHFAAEPPGRLRQLPGVEQAPGPSTLARLHPRSPYAGFDLAAHPGDLQGWNSYNNVFADVIAEVRPRRMIEVGVWKGTATIHMARTAMQLGLDCELIAIDTWLGSPEHFLGKDRENAYESLRVKNGFPQIYHTFISNVIRAGLVDRIVPLPLASESAAVVLAALDLKADLIHVDAAHEYEPVLRDYRQYWDLLSDRGVLIGDDYAVKPGVTRASDEFAAEVGRELCGFRPKCVIARSPDIAFRIEQR
jgi:hypothetical protein